MSFLTSKLTQLPPAAVYAAVAALGFGEVGLFVGFVLPGETAVIIGGFIASRGRVNVAVLCIVVVAAVILGGSLGYFIGLRGGERLLRLGVLRRHHRIVQRALEGLNQRGATYVAIGRFTAFFRAVVPGLAGMSEMSFVRFSVANVASGAVWGVGFTMLGYLAGDAYKRVERYSSYGAIGVAVVVIGLAVWYTLRARHRIEEPEVDTDDTTNPSGTSDQG